MEYCKHKNSFCYICGHFIAKKNQRKRSENFVVWYRTFYDEAEWIDESYAPSVGCPACYSSLKRSFQNVANQTKYKTPMTWNNPGEHNSETCYFCKNLACGDQFVCSTSDGCFNIEWNSGCLSLIHLIISDGEEKQFK